MLKCIFVIFCFTFICFYSIFANKTKAEKQNHCKQIETDHEFANNAENTDHTGSKEMNILLRTKGLN